MTFFSLFGGRRKLHPPKSHPPPLPFTWRSFPLLVHTLQSCGPVVPQQMPNSESFSRPSILSPCNLASLIQTRPGSPFMPLHPLPTQRLPFSSFQAAICSVTCAVMATRLAAFGAEQGWFGDLGKVERGVLRGGIERMREEIEGEGEGDCEERGRWGFEARLVAHSAASKSGTTQDCKCLICHFLCLSIGFVLNFSLLDLF